MMNLWVRSQNKKILAKVNCFTISGRKILGYQNYFNMGDFSYDGTLQSDCDLELGKYKSEERALEVLDEIQELLNPLLLFENCLVDKEKLEKIKDFGAIMVGENQGVKSLDTIKIYEMPKE